MWRTRMRPADGVTADPTGGALVPPIPAHDRELHPHEPAAVAGRVVPPADVRARRVPGPSLPDVRGNRGVRVPVRNGPAIRGLRATREVGPRARVDHRGARGRPDDVRLLL